MLGARTVTVLLLLSCALLLGACTTPADRTGATAAPSSGTVLTGDVPSDLLSLPLVDSRGRATTIGAFRGRVVVVSDMMTLCQETCAIGTASMLRAARSFDRSVRGRDVVFLSVSIDPTRDDLRHLAAYQRAFGAPPNWRTVTGPVAAVDRLWNRLGVWRHRVRVPRPYPHDWLTGAPLTSDVLHSDDLVFIDGRQRFRFEMQGSGTVPARSEIPPRIYRFMDRLGRQDVARPSTGEWSAGDVLGVLRWLVPASSGTT